MYDAVGADVQPCSVSGGTDVCAAFVGAVPLLPVRAGEISCRLLGAPRRSIPTAIRARRACRASWSITEPMPSMPVGFWGDADGSQLPRRVLRRLSPGVWRHGDWITFTDDGACVITGRSDATLNRGGVRLGTSDFYAVVEELPEVADSLVVHLEATTPTTRWASWCCSSRSRPAPSSTTTCGARIAAALRAELSPRHVPDAIEAVPAVPAPCRARSSRCR